MDYFDEMSEERPVQFTAGVAPKPEISWGDSPNDYIKAVGGALGAPGLARAGLGMLGGAARAIDPVQRMFSPGGIGTGMLAGLGIGPAAASQGQAGSESDAELEAELERIEQARANAMNMDPARLKAMHDRRVYILQKLGRPVQYERSLQKRSGMLGEMMAARPSGAGARRDKKLRDAEDEATRTG